MAKLVIDQNLFWRQTPKHISEMTPSEMKAMQNAVQDAAVKFVNDNGFGGLSHGGWFNFYAALQDAVFGEWSKAKHEFEPHQQRVVKEKEELDKKVNALSAFIGESPIFDTLDQDEQERLKEQNDVMWLYSEILGKRIAAFGSA
jgi:hypothetical protein